MGRKHDKIEIPKLAKVSAFFSSQVTSTDAGVTHYPLDQLVPKLLKAAPVDPFSGKSLIYRPQGTNWLLYSVGTDGVDDGGVPGTTTGDLLLDSSW